MSFRAGLFDSTEIVQSVNGYPQGNKAETADFFAHYFAGLVGDGVPQTPTDNLQVVATSGMVVRIKPGSIYIKGYHGWLAEPEDITIESSAQVRTVYVGARLNLTTGEIVPYYGTTIVRTDAVYEMPLAKINIQGSAVSITDDIITDLRGNPEYCGYIEKLTDATAEQLAQEIATKADQTFAEDIAGRITNPNLLINGGFDFWQRGTEPFSVGATTTYTADRWAAYAIGGGTATVAKQDAGVLSLAGKYAFLVQAVEPLPSFDRSKPYTFSIDLKRDSGNTGVQMGIALKDTISGDWIYQDQINANAGINEWNRVSITSSGLDQYTANYLMVYIKVNAPSGGTLYARRAKLEQGSVATPYVPRPYGLEKDLCRRYYQKSEHGVASTYGITTSSTTLQVWFKFDVYMRTKPTVVLFEPGWGAEWHIWRIDQMGRDGFNRVDEMDYTKEGFDKFILGNAAENVPGYWWYYTADAEIY